MEEGGGGEPWRQRCIFDGIPPPVSSPAKDGVGPMRAEKNSAGEKSPGNHGPAAGDVDPFLAGIFHDQRSQREGERYGEPHVSEVEHRGMNHYFRILEQRVQAGAVGWKRALHNGERMRSEIQQQEKENLHRGNYYGSVGKKTWIGFVAKPQHEAVCGEQQRPEQQRALLARPQCGEFIRSGKVAIAVMKNVGDGKIVLKCAEDQNHRSQEYFGEGCDASEALRPWP